MNTPIRRKFSPLLLLSATALWLPAPFARADQDCSTAGDSLNAQISDYKTQRDDPNTTDDDRQLYQAKITNLVGQQAAMISSCNSQQQQDQQKQKDLDRKQAACQKKVDLYPSVYSWNADSGKCVSKADTAASKPLPSNDDCGAASSFSGDLKGENCKKAMTVVKDVSARNDALSGATTAATAAYGNMQANGATGAQDDAQTRQANIMKTLAMSKFATGALSLGGAMQLKSAASGAEDASSTISGAQQNIQNACANTADDEACFYQTAPQYGIPADQLNYASFSRMKQAAQQSQDQADQANSAAKTAMLSGAADLLVGLQAMKAAQMAGTNAAQFAPMPMVPVAPPSAVSLNTGASGPGAPSLAQAGAVTNPGVGTPYGAGAPFGAQHHGVIAGAMDPSSKMGTPNSFKPAASGVSGGGGGGGGIGGGGLKSGAPARAPAARKNTSIGEYNLAGGGKGPGGGASASPGEKDNPLADMLAKLFPQGQDGKPIVDTRQIASAAGASVMEDDQSDPAVSPTDLSIFEQITAKYRQLNNSGRF